MYRTNRLVLLVPACLAALTAACIFQGCSGDDPASPDPPIGTVVVDCAPDTLAAPWTLSMPGGEVISGSADTTVNNAATGIYVHTWGDVNGWYSPSPRLVRDELSAGATLTFTGIYSVDVYSRGNVVVDPNPDSLNAPWRLFCPDGVVISGNGDVELSGMVAGIYRLTWDPVPGWATPSGDAQTLTAGITVGFYGEHLEYERATYAVIPPAPVAMPAVFTMGDTVHEDETPHQVTLTRSFEVATTEVTNAQYVASLQWAYDQGLVVVASKFARDTIDGSDAVLLHLGEPGFQVTFADGVFSTELPNRPVVEVSWYGAAAYCDWLSLQAGIPRAYDHSTWQCNGGDPYGAQGFRLPTEAEREFACRAGTTTSFYTGDCIDSATEANFNGAFPPEGCPTGPHLGRTADVGSYLANGWGLFDMHYNVIEWCNDWYGDYIGDETDPVGPTSGALRVLRDGSWHIGDGRSAARARNTMDATYQYNGLRPVRSLN